MRGPPKHRGGSTRQLASFFGWAALQLLNPGLQVGLFLLAPFVVVLLGLRSIDASDRTGRIHPLYKFLQRVQLVCAASAAVSFLFPKGVLAALLAVPWLAFGLACATFGLIRFLPRGFRYSEEVAPDIGLMFLPVGCIWLVLSRLGARPLGFGDDIVLLTAIHFHYAGFAASVFAGMAGRLTNCVLPITGLLIGTPLLAMGITFSPLLEVFATILLATSILALALLTLTRTKNPFLLIACLSTIGAMALACAYALGNFTNNPRLTIARMAETHGMANAFGFALCGLLGWSFSRPRSKRPAAGVPFSALSGRGYVGSDFFERAGIAVDSATAPTGLVDDLSIFEEGASVDAEIRRFYERTNEFHLSVQPNWQPGFHVGSRVFRWFAARAGQLCLPLAGEGETSIESRIFALDDKADGRDGVRAWIRTNADSGLPVYVAAYSAHIDRGVAYMNIAFPLPFGNLASILRLKSTANGGVILTTLPSAGDGDQGVYFANSILPIRLPLNETIEVWRKGEGLAAEHRLWLFGIHYLSLEYTVSRGSLR